MKLIVVQSTSGLELCIDAGMAALWIVLWMPQLKGEGLGFSGEWGVGILRHGGCQWCFIDQWIGFRHGKSNCSPIGRHSGCHS